MERNNFDNKIEGSKYIFSDAEERFTEEKTRKARYVQERADELTERFVQELQYKEEMLGNLNKGKSR